MKTRNLGKSKLKLSEIGVGCWPLGGLSTINGVTTTYGDVTEDTAIKIIRTAYELGVNTFDTADSYSFGNSEKRLGKAVKEFRSEIHIFTKAGVVQSSDKSFRIDLSYKHLISALNKSLRRLQTDYVDLFQIHKAPQTQDDYDGIEKTFQDIKKEGKALYCGISIGLDHEKGIELIERGLVDTLQLYLSLVNFKPLEKLLPLAKKKGIGIIAAEPLAQGFLSGKYEQEFSFPTNDIRSTFDTNYVKKRIEQCKQFNFLKTHSRTLSQAALAYVLSLPGVSICIPGVKTIKQLKLNVQSSEIKLTKEECESIAIIQNNWKG